MVIGDKMGLFAKIKSLFVKKSVPEIITTTAKTTDIIDRDQFVSNYGNVWQYIKPKENTQAEHVLSVISFDDWQDMDEIRKRIKDLFCIEYKHEKSLYPYIKTLVDIGLLETNSVGGKRKWRKKELPIKYPPIVNSSEK